MARKSPISAVPVARRPARDVPLPEGAAGAFVKCLRNALVVGDINCTRIICGPVSVLTSRDQSKVPRIQVETGHPTLVGGCADALSVHDRATNARHQPGAPVRMRLWALPPVASQPTLPLLGSAPKFALRCTNERGATDGDGNGTERTVNAGSWR